MSAWVRATVARFVRDDRAAMAVEFALLTPVLLALMIGTLQTGFVLEGYRRAKLSAEVLADTVARMPTLTAADVQSLGIAVRGTMSAGNGATDVLANVALVPFDATGQILATARVVPILGSASANGLRTVALTGAVPSQVLVVAQIVEEIEPLVANTLPTLTIRQTFVSPVRTGVLPNLSAITTTSLP